MIESLAIFYDMFCVDYLCHYIVFEARKINLDKTSGCIFRLLKFLENKYRHFGTLFSFMLLLLTHMISREVS